MAMKVLNNTFCYLEQVSTFLKIEIKLKKKRSAFDVSNEMKLYHFTNCMASLYLFCFVLCLNENTKELTI